MQIRDATISDIPRLIDLWLIASRDDHDHDILYPWRIAAPEDFRRLIAAEIMHMFLQGEGRFLVIETETEQRTVVAWACWTRIGTSAAAMKIRAQNDSVLKALERTLRNMQEMLRYPFIQLLSLAPSLPSGGRRAERFKELYGHFREEFWTGERKEHWFMQKLCVEPQFRRQGIATILLKWGQARAREENVFIYLMASAEGMAFYLNAGFVLAATCVMVEPDDTMPVLVWRPESAFTG